MPKSSKDHSGKRPFPAAPIEEALELAAAIQLHASGQKVRRFTLFEQLQRSPDSGSSRTLITNSGRYGLTIGGYKAEFLELSPEGNKATHPDTPRREKMRILFELAIQRIEAFKTLHDKFKENRLPGKIILEDALREAKIGNEFLAEGVETFILNCKYLGLLRTIAGAERIVSIEQALDALPPTKDEPVQVVPGSLTSREGPLEKICHDLTSTCFYISPIDDEGTPERKHSDFFLGSIVEPALDEFKLQVIRADQIAEPGIITRQILEHLLKARLVIADLSFHNPNVFYELCLRHAARLPVVQLIRAHERIPFDLSQFRTIKIDTSDIHIFVPQIEAYRAEIASQVRRALENPDSVDNPISTYFPNAKLTF